MPVKPRNGRPPARHLLAAAAALALVGAASRAGATSVPAAPPPPTVVAVVDFQRVYAGLKELADREARAGDVQKKYKDDLDAVTKNIKSLQTDAEATKANTPQRRAAQTALRDAVLTGKVKAASYNADLDFISASDSRDLYLKFLGTVEFIAKDAGYDIVLFDDRQLDIPDPIRGTDNNPITPNVVQNAIMTKSILFASDKVDITAHVLDVMNNDYAKGVDRAPRPAAAVTPPGGGNPTAVPSSPEPGALPAPAPRQ